MTGSLEVFLSCCFRLNGTHATVWQFRILKTILRIFPVARVLVVPNLFLQTYPKDFSGSDPHRGIPVRYSYSVTGFQFRG